MKVLRLPLLIPKRKAGAFTYTVSGPTASSGTSAVAGPLNLTGLTAVSIQ
jgi:hypothetical protein